eukprot:CAMPEP_0177792210 /NCGR_PEP_ID=MMETSP0491_2-20121128/24403_1 /TAXON_ID=63592 /ORGANISM="Tetraselmis chuii, Strain PLY429" /LENGTH=917 /DNA_ID=CAMNT_0019314609 /DNA_START=34 /DNA_END=2788 /DNA_ORIENTATION=+
MTTPFRYGDNLAEGSVPAAAMNVDGCSSIPALFHASEVLASPDKITKADADLVDGRRLTLTNLSEWTRDYGQNSAGASANVEGCSNCVVTQALRDEFEAVTGSVNTPMTLKQFAKAIKAKSEFLATILFERMDKSASNTLSCDDFISSVSIIRYGSLNERLSFAFHLYDVDRSGSIEKADIVKMLRICLQENRLKLDEELVARMASGMMRTLDADHDGTLSLADFSKIESVYPGLALVQVDRLQPDTPTSSQATTASPKSPAKMKFLNLRDAAKQRTSSKNTPLQKPFSSSTTSTAASSTTSTNFTSPSRSFESASRGNKQAPTPSRARKAFFPSTAAWFWLRNNPQHVLCMLLMLAMFGAAFYITAETFCVFQGLPCAHENEDLRALFGYGLMIAKGSAGSTKVAFAIIIFPVCRNTMTALRETFLRKLLPFDDAIAWHKIIAAFSFGFAFLHVFAHVWNFYVFSSPSRQAAFQHAFGESTQQPSAISLWTTAPAITGLVMCSILIITFAFAMEWPRRAAWLRDTAVGRALNNFNNFAATHCLFVVFYLCFIFHAFPKPYGYGDMWCWLAIPMGIYLTEKVMKCCKRRRQDVEIVDAVLMPGDTVYLQISKPSGFKYLSGQYVFLCLPELAWMEWHPFTLTSAPDDDFISLHIRSAGDWTGALRDTIRDVTARRDRALEGDVEGGHVNPLFEGASKPELPPFPKVCVDGPFGAPAQKWRQYKTVVMVGAGIGVTPCASVLRDVLRNIEQPDGNPEEPQSARNTGQTPPATRKVFFYWCTREKEEATWFRHELESIAQIDTNKVLDINIHITSVKSDGGLAPNFLKMGQMSSHAVHGKDVMTGMETNFITKFGRPDWNAVLADVARSCSPSSGKNTDKVGVFFCGPPVLAKAISSTCTAMNKGKTVPVKFDFYQEHF